MLNGQKGVFCKGLKQSVGCKEKHAVAPLHPNQMRLPSFYPTIDLLIFQTMFIIFNNVIFLEVFINQLGFKIQTSSFIR